MSYQFPIGIKGFYRLTDGSQSPAEVVSYGVERNEGLLGLMIDGRLGRQFEHPHRFSLDKDTKK